MPCRSTAVTGCAARFVASRRPLGASTGAHARPAVPVVRGPGDEVWWPAAKCRRCCQVGITAGNPGARVAGGARVRATR